MTTPTDLKLADCLAISDVVISAVPVESYKVPTKALKDGCVCVNVAGEKNFEADVRERVSRPLAFLRNHDCGWGKAETDQYTRRQSMCRVWA